MKNILFITGTDTGVGKTTISGGLCRLLAAEGLRVGVCKAIETGCELGKDGELFPADAAFLHSCLLPDSPQSRIEDIVYRRFAPAVAPSVAASIIGESIDFQEICQLIIERSKSVDILLVEGAGGLLVPINDELTMLDLAKEVEATVLLVVASKLGALNHACLSFSAISTAGLSSIGYVFNELSSPTEEPYPLAKQTNRKELARLAKKYGESELAYLPDLKNPRDLREIDRIFQGPEMKPFLESIIEYFDLRR
jgi:dethiobiotin synthetase